MTGDDLASRVRAILAQPGLTEQRMFGGTCFMLNGNMVAGASPRGLLLRVSKDADRTALARRGATPMEQGGRTMTGFVNVEPVTIATDEGLKAWLETALAYVQTLPAKTRAEPKPRRKK